jgi:hypothetical protein
VGNAARAVSLTEQARIVESRAAVIRDVLRSGLGSEGTEEAADVAKAANE